MINNKLCNTHKHNKYDNKLYHTMNIISEMINENINLIY